MKTAGVIVEYNPFHNGHLYHINETRKETNADIIIAVMSGNFLQRGEPALVSKWARTKMALEGGADIIIELPYMFATQKATTFAFGSIYLLEALLVDEICFGSENGLINDFQFAINHLTKNQQEYNEALQQFIKKGMSFPKSASQAFKLIAEGENLLDLTKPNNILGFQYMSAIQKLSSNMKAKTIQRVGSNYHDESIQSSMASATSIRKTLFQKDSDLNEVQQVIPSTTYKHLSHYLNQYQQFHQWENYFPLLKYRLLTMSKEELNDIYEAEEGLENRLLDRIKYCNSFLEFMESIKTKRYTWTRLQRFCLHILANVKKEQMYRCMDSPRYIRLLGMSLAGQAYLKNIKKQLTLPLIATLSSFKDEQLEIDLKSVNTYASILPEPLQSEFIKREYSTPPIRFDRKQQVFL